LDEHGKPALHRHDSARACRETNPFRAGRWRNSSVSSPARVIPRNST